MSASDAAVRFRLLLRGTVQGVGFRPFVYRQATALGLAGWVANSTSGVTIEAEGNLAEVQALIAVLHAAPPPNAFIAAVETCRIPLRREAGFVIHPSDVSAASVAHVLPDLATCDDCLREMLDPVDRRYLYPFINCTQCGPRYSIIEAVPYDRERTSMRHFRMCKACQAEYDDPADRRFHAEPNACPVCGPRLSLLDGAGHVVAHDHAAIAGAAAFIRAGRIIAAKGIGGFHLIADAGDSAAVQELRRRKHREAKPFAVMAANLAAAQRCGRISPDEAALLTGTARPIVLLRRIDGAVADAVAPGNPFLGVMLPYAPVHHLLLRQLGSPIVATSGNVSDEPIVTDTQDALARLHGIADMFLVHDRPIVRPVDDPVMRVMGGREIVLRCGRGIAPVQFDVSGVAGGILAVGGHLKTSVALTRDHGVVLGQHVGDLDTARARAAHASAVGDLAALHMVEPRVYVRDPHPDYASGGAAEAAGLPVIAVQHHLAHIVACMAEHGLRPPVLGVAWDGAGLGPDGTIWGGEFLHVTPDGWSRAAHLRPFRLPGGDAAGREPRRSALGLLFCMFGDAAFERSDLAAVAGLTAAERRVFAAMLSDGTNAPWTSSIGRLFDAFASISGVRQRTSYEGQAAAELEWAADGYDAPEAYAFPVVQGCRSPHRTRGGESWVHPRAPLLIDWQPALAAALTDLRSGLPIGAISGAFHAGLAAAIAEIAGRIGERCVVLSGGCFQNARLTEAAVAALRAAGHDPVWHRRVPPNDGGLALGQAVWAAWSERPRR